MVLITSTLTQNLEYNLLNFGIHFYETKYNYFSTDDNKKYYLLNIQYISESLHNFFCLYDAVYQPQKEICFCCYCCVLHVRKWK